MKNFIRGMGVGILITTLVFAIAYMLNGDKLSDDEIKQRARKLGMVEQDTTVVKPKEDAGVQNTDTTPQAVVPGDVSGQTVLVTDGGQYNIDGTIVQGDSDAMQQISEPAIVDLSGNSVMVQITKGQDGITISHMLQQAGVVTDAADFNRYLSENRLQLDILWGDFVLEKNMTYEAIVDRIIAR